MTVSVLFSAVIYTGANNELRRFERLSIIRREVDFFGPRIAREPAFDSQEIADLRRRLILTLLLVNLGIFAFSALFGYILAGKTLRPIELMLADQKRFVADASHELRTPLTAMITEIEVALRGKTLDLPTARKLLKSNLEEASKMHSLSNHLLSLSRYQTADLKLPREKFDLTELVQNVVAKLRPLASKKGVTINTDLQNIDLTANPDSLAELLTILLDNAVKYSRPQGKVIVKTQKAGNRAEISVQDFGIGINSADLPHIFDRFYRADASRSKDQTTGYGLGLAIARSIVELHNGKILVTSAPGAGTTFRVLI
ncbi:MAG: Integral membrane sensor signal transduction histidine kinase [Microgenomates group bacterium GW2011_GWA1_48_10]|nr:MAG: Integral membrane sensor signal transduction histidine kinase [Microgenomates group bacterium GW2011_GWA1_48_10]